MNEQEAAKQSAKDYLSQAYHIEQRIHSKLSQVQSLRALASRATATFSETLGNTSSNSQGMEDFLLKALDLEKEIHKDLIALMDLKQELVNCIKCVANPELQTLLELRYLCYESWREIAVKMRYDIRHVHRLHGRALQEVERIFKTCHEMS